MRQYAEICMTVKKLLRDDIRECNTMRVKEDRKRPQEVTTKEECKVMIYLSIYLSHSHVQTEIYKTVRKLLRDDIREYNTMRVKEAVETGNGLKKAPNKE